MGDFFLLTMIIRSLQTGGAFTTILQIVVLSAATLEPYDMLYTSGMDAFNQEDYANVVRFMEKALRSFSKLRKTTIGCRLKCDDQYELNANVSELNLFDVILRRASCLKECIDTKLGPQSIHKASEDILQDFRKRIPYNYLQRAYLKVKINRQLSLKVILTFLAFFALCLDECCLITNNCSCTYRIRIYIDHILFSLLSFQWQTQPTRKFSQLLLTSC